MARTDPQLPIHGKWNTVRVQRSLLAVAIGFALLVSLAALAAEGGGNGQLPDWVGLVFSPILTGVVVLIAFEVFGPDSAGTEEAVEFLRAYKREEP